MVRRSILFSFLPVLAWAADAPPAAPPCAAPEFARMDFWLGEWDVKWEGGEGRNTITKTLDGCVVLENFDGGPSVGGMVGISVSIYHAPTKLWRQTWVDNQGGYFDLIGGPDGANRFVLTNVRLDENAPHLRMVFEDITAEAFTWRWQGSDDGAEWTDRWVISYTRTP